MPPLGEKEPIPCLWHRGLPGRRETRLIQIGAHGALPVRRQREGAAVLPLFRAPSPFRLRGPHPRGVNGTTRKPGVPCPATARGWRGCAPSCPRSTLRASLQADRRATGEQTPLAPPLGASSAELWVRHLAERALLTHTPAEPASCRTRGPNACKPLPC